MDASAKEKILDRAQKNVLKGYFDRAILDYQAALEMDPKDATTRLRLGDLYVKSGMKAEAIREYIEVAKTNAQKGFYLKAIAVFKQALKLDETNLDVHNRLAELYIKQRLIADAISEYGYILNVFEKKGRAADAVDLLKKMLDIDPENVGLRLKLAESYQRSSFDRDALLEYSLVFQKLMAQGRLETAEKVYAGLYSSGSRDPEVLKGLSEIYKRTGDAQQFLRYSRPLFGHYRDQSMTEQAKELAASILEVSPAERECAEFLESFKPKPAAPPHPLTDSSQESVEAPPVEAPLQAEAGPAPEPQAETQNEDSALPTAEDIEIILEGFEDATRGVSETPFHTVATGEALIEEIGSSAGSAGGEGVEDRDEVEITLPPEAFVQLDLKSPESGLALAPAAPEAWAGVEDVPEEAPAAAESKSEETPAASGVEFEPVEVEFEIVSKDEASKPVPPDGNGLPSLNFEPDVVAKEDATSGAGESAGEAQRPVEAGFEIIARDEERPATGEGIAAEAPLEEIEFEILPVEGEARPVPQEAGSKAGPGEVAFEIIPEAGEKGTRPTEEALPATGGEPEEIAFEIFDRRREAGRSAEEVPGELEFEALEPVVEKGGALSQEEGMPGGPVELTPEDVRQFAEGAASGPVVKADDALKGPEDADFNIEIHEVSRPGQDLKEADSEDISKAITELMDQMDVAGIPADSGEERPEEKYIDLTAEVGMEEVLKDKTSGWEGQSARETMSELKDSLGRTLEQEDPATHFKLGIAYMESGLLEEASSEFKIALKDASLAFDSCLMLGRLSMRSNQPEEAVSYYLKGLKVPGRSDEERKGMMFDMGLAYEAAGQSEESLHIFKSIHSTDPWFRGVAEKLSAYADTLPRIPMDDGLIEIELL